MPAQKSNAIYYLSTELADKFWNFLIENINIFNYKYETMTLSVYEYEIKYESEQCRSIPCPTELISYL